MYGTRRRWRRIVDDNLSTWYLYKVEISQYLMKVFFNIKKYLNDILFQKFNNSSMQLYNSSKRKMQKKRLSRCSTFKTQSALI